MGTMTDQPLIRAVHTSTDYNFTIKQQKQTDNCYLSSGSILGTERYKVDYNVLRGFVHMLNELDSNLPLNFARLVNKNFQRIYKVFLKNL